MKLLLIFLSFACLSTSYAQKIEGGSISGTIVDKASARPAEYVAVSLKNSADGGVVQKTATDAGGRFGFKGVPFGDYILAFGYVGTDGEQTPPFAVDAAHRQANLGRLMLNSNAIRMEKVEVSERKDAFYNSIDRKVYNVGKEIQSLTGSASDLLGNVPS